MKISLIVARTKNNVIGKDNQMPWHLPVDLAWFKNNTINKPVIMGRKTYESIGRLLPNRPNIILSRSNFNVEGALSASSLEQGLKIANELTDVTEVIVIGGGELFKQALPLADTLYLTEIQAEIEGDTYFEFDETEWCLATQQWSEIDDKNPYQCRFMIFNKLTSSTDT
ncbi:dihydrofolate reductase [Phocoenobacter skyensis]|uniref:Dihydrofolate reductase n=1 Tax=Phocoenobacter skyensis TaxID=97481 RepID=A0A1H7WIN1_9PAST|nr:dihydrofolate reductase [Pasteurella skyensis]MDP8079251.1 dihydrofolate reductase [Pasteurella skyensis]MDP8085139.1 dihydrofolate reductase [Pasteurella skyensis]MDP8170053.1 dihydrofolate reductase [Pasteurella skyensis]MDP8175076.1 dihydrofolate reductase [Pasteurella skyensis]MDP8185056.1 dihydrofolate reductase [Pasteurella skyensis]